MLQKRTRMLKPLLLDQHFIAGLGNIYVDEALWEAGLHPCRRASSLSPAECKKLFLAIPRVLKRGLRNLGTTLGTGKANFFSVAGRRGGNIEQLRVFRRTGLPCPRCTAPIQRIIVGQRSTHICPGCQE
jgi:formamidopyrimidine-DNA glycosylase